METQTRENILSNLHGQSVRIPNLKPLYANFPFLINPNQDTVTSTVHSILETYSMTPAEERKLKNANLPLLIASWYPFSDAETLKQITYFVSWMYVIDDAIIDKISWPGLDNATAFDAAYAELMDFVFRSLDLDDVVKNEQPKSSVPAIDSFRLIGQILCEKYSLAQRRKFFEACRLTMEGYRTEQRLRVSGRISSWEEYWTYREGSSCMSMNVAMIELAIGSHLPEEVLDSEEMKLLCKQTVVVSWLVNDIVSAKKELSEGFIENAVPLLAIESGNAQDGMDNTVGFAKQAVARFEELALNAERKFCSLVEDEMAMSEWGRASPETLAAEVSKFIESCKCIMTGALSWSLVSPRYGLQLLQKDSAGGVSFMIGQ